MVTVLQGPDTFASALGKSLPGALDAMANRKFTRQEAEKTREFQAQEAEKGRRHQLLLEGQKEAKAAKKESTKITKEELVREQRDQSLDKYKKYFGEHTTNLLKSTRPGSEAESKLQQIAFQSMAEGIPLEEKLAQRFEKNPEEVQPIVDHIKELIRQRSGGGAIGQEEETAVPEPKRVSPQENIPPPTFRQKNPGESLEAYNNALRTHEEKEHERDVKKYDTYAEKISEKSKTIPRMRADIATLRRSLDSGSGFNRNVLAQVFSAPYLQNAEGVALNTSVKNLLIEQLSNIPGGRLNQWIEQRTAGGLPGVGNPKAGNEIATDAAEFKADLDAKEVELFDKYYKQYNGKPPASIIHDIDNELLDYSYQRQDKLMYDMETHLESAMSDEEIYRKAVIPGTFLTNRAFHIFVDKAGGDKQKAARMAIEKGYIIPTKKQAGSNQ